MIAEQNLTLAEENGSLVRTNITEKMVKQKDKTYKKIQHIVDEEGNKFDIELEDSKYEIFFVQGFTCRWNDKNSYHLCALYKAASSRLTLWKYALTSSCKLF